MIFLSDVGLELVGSLPTALPSPPISHEMVPSASLSLAAAAALFSNVLANPLPRRALTNEDTSLTLLFQNNLNATDDVNHVGAILLDEMPYTKASPACAAIGESLIEWGTLEYHRFDFERQLAYQSFIGKSKPTQRYYILNNVISATQADGSLQLITPPTRDIALPVLCTQSSHGNSPSAPATDSNKITVSSGSNTYVGFRNLKSFRFLGIPYVAFPGRFKYSVYPSAPSGVTVDATKYRKQCSQPWQAEGTTAEDCLILNIQTPYIPKQGSTERLRPVHFWIHGGGFTGGTGNDAGSDGGNLASREDVVTVNINYRLSTLGFLAIPGTDIKGNFAISDMIAALKWTIDNIAAFGGDPNRIVINGESAGGGSTRVLLGSPPAIPLFQGAISMSNLGFGYALGIGYSYANTYSDYLTIQGSYNIAGQQIFAALGCTQAYLDDQIACLKTKDPLAIVTANTVARYVVQDGYYVDTPRLEVSGKTGSVAYVDVMFGITRDDGASFSTYPKTPVTSILEGLQVGLNINTENAQKVIDSGLFPAPNTGDITLDSFNVTSRIATDLQFRCVDQATVYAGDQTGVFKSAHYFQMDRTYQGYDPNNLGGPPVTEGYPYGNPNLPYFRVHGSDMPNVFGNLSPLRDENDLSTIQLSSGYFAEFIKKGTPNIPTRYLTARGYHVSLVGVELSGRWSEVRGKSGPIMLIDFPARSSSYVDVEQCAWLGYPLDYYLTN
ncbi:Cholinesterase [Dactylella cylindrospora]|nr:Cholinesterase [Dactylella cylindrospora]